MMKIIYLHGFNSGANSSTANKLKDQYDDVVSFTYDCTDANVAYGQINNVITENMRGGDVLLVGTSLGGFWANYFSEKYRLPCLLINPSLYPYHSLRKFVGQNRNFDTGESYMLTDSDVDTYRGYASTRTHGVTKFVYLCVNDDVVDYRTADNFFSGYRIVYDRTQGHRLEDVTVLFILIREIENTITHYDDMLDRKDAVSENFKNLFRPDDKKKYVDEVWELLQKSYASIGGIKGSGFTSKEDMMFKIPFWKLYTNSNGKVVAVVMYKDKEGRKSVAVGTDGSEEGKKYLRIIKDQDLMMNRSYQEVSDRMLSFIVKTTPDIRKYCIPFNDVVAIVNEPIMKPDDDDPEVLKHPDLKEFFYRRNIGGEWKTKLMIGTPHNTIYGK